MYIKVMYLRKTYRTVRNVTFCALASIKLRVGYRGSGGAVLTQFLHHSLGPGARPRTPRRESRLPSGDGRRAGPASTLVRLRASGPPRGHSARYNTTTAHTDDRPRSKAACTARPGTRTGILHPPGTGSPRSTPRRQVRGKSRTRGASWARGVQLISSCWAVAVAARPVLLPGGDAGRGAYAVHVRYR